MMEFIKILMLFIVVALIVGIIEKMAEQDNAMKEMIQFNKETKIFMERFIGSK